MLNPSQWGLWPAVAVLRWMLRDERRGGQALQLFYRSMPSLRFTGSEIRDVGIASKGVDLILSAPGLAAPGSSLPASDIARIMSDSRRGGGMAAWLDGFGDRFMQALEAAEARSNVAFALSTGGRIEALRTIANLVGRTATLNALQGAVLSSTIGAEPEGAVGLAPLFLGRISASGLAQLFEAVTGLPVRIEEFSGAEVLVMRPARVGRPFGRMLGAKCRLAAAGIEIVIDGGTRPESREWARDSVRRRSLHRLSLAYIGSPSPVAGIFLQLAPDNVPPAALDGMTAIGGLAVLGKAREPVRLPLAG